jgi:photosystem II stability/assembly factor-like uncharacterized protein
MHARRLSALSALVVAGALAAGGVTGADAAGAAVGGGRAAVHYAGQGFAVASVSFWSPARGVALGGVACGYGTPCAARLMITSNGGLRWRFLRAPGADVASGRPSRSVSRVLFTSARRGWLYGPALWSTSNGGARWRKLSLGGAVDAMAAGAGRVLAVVAPGHGKARELFTSPAGHDSWTRVRRVSGNVLAVLGRSAWLGSNRYLWATADGRHWRKYPFRCPAATRSIGLASIAPATSMRVLFVCLGAAAGPQQAKDLIGSTNGGKTSHLIRALQLSGDTAVIATPPGRPTVIALGTEYYLDTSADGGKTWSMKFVAAGGGAPWNSLSFLSPTAGWAEVGQPPSYDALFRTTNAGRTWHRVRF